MCAKERVMGGFLWSWMLWICVTLYSTICVDDNGCCCELCDDSNLVLLRMRLLWMVWQFIPQLLWCCCELCDDSFHCLLLCCWWQLLLWVVWWLIDPKCCGVVDVYCCELCDYDSFILRLLMVVCLAVVREQTNQRVFLHNSQKEQPLFVSWRVQEQTFSLLKKRRNKLCLLKKCRNKLCCLLKNAEFCFVNIDISRGCQFVWLLAWSFDGWPAAAFSIR